MVTTSIQIYADTVSVDMDDKSVVVGGIDLPALIGQFSVEELLEAIKDNDMFSDIEAFVTKELKR